MSSNAQAACCGCLVNWPWVNQWVSPPQYFQSFQMSAVLPKQELGLTKEEKDILQQLASAWGEYSKIETKESNLNEFVDAIHRCQQLIALRVARRVDPDVWVQGG